MQAEAWLSHWAGCEKPGSWLIPDQADSRSGGTEASIGKEKEGQIFLPFFCSVHIDHGLSLFCNFVFVPFAMKALKHTDSLSSHKWYGSSTMSFLAFSIF